ncbi:complement C1q-like protein 4 [Perca fluviatilis]|uniref:complement C1q-like protein 4 n=1 Tax=Perca fluviatilis TaxID=8168 RepID=UPI0019633790|nr:complement C1q-like protein 4 [Perca fluviatilis]
MATEQAAQLKAEVDEQKQQQEVQQIAFSAGLLASGGNAITIGPLPADTPLIFKYVPTNIGNAYNSNTGVFTAPVRGAYHFEWTVSSNKGQESGGWLVKNSANVFLAYQDGSGWMTSSKAATLLLEVGDVVFVRLMPNTVVFDNLNHHTTFSGHLLFPM